MSEKQEQLWELVKSFQDSSGGGYAKAVQVTAFFDKRGNLIGKTEATVVELYPGAVSKLVEMLFGK